jgi:hypothetical protein
LLNFADAARDEVVRARAQAAEEHAGLLLHVGHPDAGRRQARRRPDKSCRGGGEGDDELHGSNLFDWQLHDSMHRASRDGDLMSLVRKR